MEHLEHFGLSRDPFSNDPQVAAYFESPEHKSAATRLSRGVVQQKGFCLFTGPAGAGKSMVVRHLLESLEEDVYEACVLVPVPGVADSSWVLHRFAALLGVEGPADERGALLGQVYDQLAVVREDGRHTVLFVDEAEVLEEQDALGDLRVLLNLEYEERRLLTLVLIGTEALERQVARQRGLADRLDVHVRIQPLELRAATDYLVHRIRRVGGSPAILESGALPTLVERAGGVPRRLNTIADNALFEAFLAGRVSATVEDVTRAADDLVLSAGDDLEGPGGTDLDDVFSSSLPPQRPAASPLPDPTSPGPSGMPGATMILGHVTSEDSSAGILRGESLPPEEPSQSPVRPVTPTAGPPKDEELDDLFVDLVEE